MVFEAPYHDHVHRSELRENQHVYVRLYITCGAEGEEGAAAY
jgi:hypothetical protein